MRVDFYQLSRGPVEAALPLIARRTLQQGERMLVVSADAQQCQRISRAMWAYGGGEAFLANGIAGEGDEERQPILLSSDMVPMNGARYLAIADGRWREGDTAFERVFFLFDDETVQHARETWRGLRGREGAERHYWKQEDGRWVQAG
jgi:DNA polymerase III, chi subunit